MKFSRSYWSWIYIYVSSFYKACQQVKTDLEVWEIFMLSLDRTWVSKDTREKRGEIRGEESKPLPAPNSRRDEARLSQILTEASRRESVYYSLLKVICEVFKNTPLRNMWRTKFYEWIKHSYVRCFTVWRLTLNTVWGHLVIIPDSLPVTQI